MPSLILHAGAPKCGSTSLQVWLYAHRKEAAEHDILLPAMVGEGSPLGHHKVAGSLVKASLRTRDVDPGFTRLIDEFRHSGHDRVLLTAESFIMRAMQYQRHAFGSLLSEIDAEVLLMLRERATWVHAFYKENVKLAQRRFNGTFRDFIRRPPSYAQTPGNMSFVARLDRLCDALGARQTRRVVVALEPGGTDSRDAIADLAGLPRDRRMPEPGELDKPNRNIELKRGFKINASLDDAATEFLRVLNSFEMSSELRKSVRYTLMESADVTAPLRIKTLLPGLARWLREKATEDDAQLKERFGIAFAPPPVQRDVRYVERIPRDAFDTIAEGILPRLTEAAERDELAAVVKRSDLPVDG